MNTTEGIIFLIILVVILGIIVTSIIRAIFEPSSTEDSRCRGGHDF
jgi:hypothetical protein